MQDACLCLDIENLGCHILDGPVIHGSRRMVKDLAGLFDDGGNGSMGVKVRRNEASELMCLTVKDIFEVLNDKIEEFVKGHGSSITGNGLGNTLFLEIVWPRFV